MAEEKKKEEKEEENWLLFFTNFRLFTSGAIAETVVLLMKNQLEE